MRNISLTVAILAAFLLSGCTAATVLQTGQYALDEIKQKYETKRGHDDKKLEMVYHASQALAQQGYAHITNGDTEEGVDLIERALKLMDDYEPEFMVEGIIERHRQRKATEPDIN